MDYISTFNSINFDYYPPNDIGVARLFYTLHRDTIRYVIETKTWYTFTGKLWSKDSGGFRTMELCKAFVENLAQYVAENRPDDAAFVKYTAKLASRSRRESILADARSIEPLTLTVFDRDRFSLNLQNGTFDLREMKLRPHSAGDYITKQAKVMYVEKARSERWERFIDEVTDGRKDLARYLQKALGYCLSGDTLLECFFILYGSTTRNGKSTAMNTISTILGDYAKNVQPQTLSRRPNDGAAPSPDIAQLKGARLVTTSEPEKGLELNAALIKQLTGGDTYTGRFLNENPVEFRPEFAIFFNTNHLPVCADSTIFESGRVRIIPFDRHFPEAEQDKGLKRLFLSAKNRSGILNWLIEGYRMLQDEGLTAPECVTAAIAEYREEADVIGEFLAACTVPTANHRQQTSELYGVYLEWARSNGFKVMDNRGFVGELRRRCEVKRDCAKGNVVVGLAVNGAST